MSWDPPSGAPSPEADQAARWQYDLDLARLVRDCGATLLDALEQHRPGARGHADATASYGFAGAVELRLEREHAEAIREAARLHEVGLIYVPAATLAAAPEDRTADQRALLESHAAYGAEIARGAGVPDQACAWIRSSMERFDGRGPAGLAGERIPLESRIIRVACACDTVLTAPVAAASHDERRALGLARLRELTGRELDPRVVAALSAMLERVTRS